VVGGGSGNRASGNFSFIGSGRGNQVYGYETAIAGGILNSVNGDHGFVGGGRENGAVQYGVVTGGYQNTAGVAGTVGGGTHNNASGVNSTIPGGYNNSANGAYSFAAGYSASAAAPGSFVWSDSENVLISNTTNEFRIRAGGGYVFLSTPTAPTVIVSNGAILISTSALAATAVPNIFISSVNGNIGLGTNNPGTKLDVNGAAQFGANATKSTFSASGFLDIAGSTLTIASSGIITAPSQSGARVRLVNDQLLASSAVTPIFFGDESCVSCYDNQSVHNTSVSSNVFTTRGAGIYYISCSVVWEANATGIRSIYIADDSSNSTIFAVTQLTAGSANTLITAATAMVSLPDNQPLQCNVRQDSGVSINVFGSLNTVMTIQKIW
jgi:hypothetical protein